jgi:hypothetical protein
MEIVKKNLVSVVCGVIALMAIVALFWPISGYYKQLQTTVDSRKSVYTSLKGLLTKQRQLPVVDPFTAETKPLDQFPTSQVILLGRAVTEKVKNESAAIVDEALKLNQREPLVPGALPMPMTSQAVRFRDVYKQRVDYLSNENRANSFPMQIMQAGFPPSDGEVQAKKAEIEAGIKQKIAYNGQGQPINGVAIDAELAEKLPLVPKQMKIDAAKNCKVYIDIGTFEPYALLMQAAPGIPPDPSTIFNAQATLWIQEDVCRSIAAANSDSQNVMESPVKHLIRMGLPAMFPAGPATPGDLAGALPKNYALSPTGRSTNSVYDVIYFTLKMDVDAEQIPRVLQSLSRNKFVTVLSCSMVSIDSGLLQTEGYYYGEKPVVQLDVECESLLLRKWTEPLMPPAIKAQLGVGQAAAPTPQ